VELVSTLNSKGGVKLRPYADYKEKRIREFEGLRGKIESALFG